MTGTAVLLLVFNRPDVTREVMQPLRQARPSRIYVAADGPRAKLGEAERCAQARQIATQIDWPCEVKTLFRDQNLGCRLAVSSAIDWFFEHEEEGIILEDDCVPSPSFFPYCAELLERYRDDPRVMAISGNNFQNGRDVTQFSYYFSIYMHCWGWASWRRAWARYDHDMSEWPEFKAKGSLRRYSGGMKEFENYWTAVFNETAVGNNDSWAYRFFFSCWANNGLTILPGVNLVTNIGFGQNATHSPGADSPRANLPRKNICFPLVHPETVEANMSADAYETEHIFNIRKVSRAEKLLHGIHVRLRALARLQSPTIISR